MEELNSLDKIKEFVKWCKANKVKSFKIGDISFEISEMQLLPDLCNIENLEKAQEITENSILSTIQQNDEDEDLLFWSAN